MSVASDETDEGQPLHHGIIDGGAEVEPDVAELGSQVSEAIEAEADGAAQRPSPTAKGSPRTPTKSPAAEDTIDDEEFSEFQRPSSPDGSLSIPDDLPSVQVGLPC